MLKSAVIKHFGGVNKTARALGISRQAIAKWKRYVPKMRALEVERLSNGKLEYDPSKYDRKKR